MAGLIGAGGGVGAGASGSVGVDGVGVHRGRAAATVYTICKPSFKLQED